MSLSRNLRGVRFSKSDRSESRNRRTAERVEHYGARLVPLSGPRKSTNVPVMVDGVQEVESRTWSERVKRIADAG